MYLFSTSNFLYNNKFITYSITISYQLDLIIKVLQLNVIYFVSSMFSVR